MALTVVLKPEELVSKPFTAEEKLARIKGEVISALEDRLEELRHQSEEMKATMERALYRVNTHGFEADLEDLKSGKWYKAATEVTVLQEVRAIFENHGA